jgi:hypothetical protein
MEQNTTQGNMTQQNITEQHINTEQNSKTTKQNKRYFESTAMFKI